MTTDGHAAVGAVQGTRYENGERPNFVRVTYRRDGERGEAVVLRQTAMQQVEDTPTSSIRFIRKGGNVLRVDEIIETEAV